MELIPFGAISDRLCDLRFPEIPSRGFLIVSPVGVYSAYLFMGNYIPPVGGLLLFSFLGELHVYDQVLFCDLLDDGIALSKFSTAVGSTSAILKDPESVMDLWDSPRYPDCEYLGSIKKFMDAFTSATHAENPKEVDSKLLQIFWQINSETAKRTIKTTTQLNTQDINSKLSRNFGTNNHMLRYQRIR